MNKTIPIFIYPSELTFYQLSKETHKQLLTLYNPYEFPIKFKVHSNAPLKYTVIEPVGTLKPQSSVDMVVRHRQPIPTNCNVTDKFMIFVEDLITNQRLGKRCIVSTLLPGEKKQLTDDGSNQYDICDEDSGAEAQRGAKNKSDESFTTNTNFRNYLFMTIAAICTIALLFPTKYEPNGTTSIPTYLHISVNIKIILGFVLGTIFMGLLLPGRL